MSNRRLAGILLAVTLGLLVFAHWRHGPELGADDHGQYLLHARALVEGRPYTEIGFLHSQYSTLVAPVAEPPGLPAVLAGAMALGVSWRWVLVVSYLLAIAAVFRYWRDEEEAPWLGVVVAAWTASALAAPHAFDTVMADLPFIACTWMVLIAARRPGRTATVALVLAGCLAFSFRMAALPLIPAAATLLLLGPDRAARTRWAIALVAWTLVALAILVGMSAGSALGSETVRGPGALVADLRLNVAAMVEGAWQSLPVMLPMRGLRWSVGAVVGALALVGAWTHRHTPRHRVTWVFSAWYLLMLLTLPTRAGRYLWPLVPLVPACLCWGALRLPGLASRRGRTIAALAGALVATGTWQQLRRAAPPTWATMADIDRVTRFLVLEQRRDPATRVAFFSPRVLTWETGIPSAPLFGAPPDTARSFLVAHGVTHVVQGDAGTWAIGASGMDALIASQPTWLRQVYADPTFRVWRLEPR
ncbi:MAG: hypothetical protein JNJ98_06425 [Gemmatimonadetes bacterium]|nr:hypothetical protein [Gemmatimonadota bacterium]